MTTDSITLSPSLTATPIEELWERYRKTRTPELEDALVRAHLPYVRQAADRVNSRVPANVEYDDLLQNGHWGLLDAIRNWDPAMASFRTYATLKINSRILDGLRSSDWLTRDLRKQVRTVQTATVELVHALNRTPTDQEIADHLNITLDEVQTAFLNHTTAHVTSLDDLLPGHGDEDSSTTLAHRLVDHTASPHDAIEQRHEINALRAALDYLEPRHRQVLCFYFFENLTLANIGEILGVTESRVCQIRAKALIILRGRLADLA